jgi:hypothetical protein
MRTTLTIDDDLFRALKERAHQTGRPLRAVVNEALQEGLTRPGRRAPKPHRMQTFRLGRPRGVDLVKALALAAAFEDEEVVRELEQRK